MSIKKFRLNRKNSSGSYDTIHYETSSNIVLRPDGTTVEESLSNNNLPSGIIAMWSGASDNIPTGWLLCDGTNNTPDLRNRFIVGAGSSYSIGNTGGSDSVTLTTEQLPSHTHAHSLSAASAGAHTHSHSLSVSLSGLSCSSSGSHTHAVNFLEYTGGQAQNIIPTHDPDRFQPYKTRTDIVQAAGAHTHTISGTGTLSGSISSGGAHVHSVSGSISSTGSNGSHENRPPYYALCFIMKE